MTEEDHQHVLDEDVFSYQITKRNTVFLFWRGKCVTTLKDNAAAQFLAKIARTDQRGQQLLMAKITGNFKRGNERR
jgi:hypothetical protein